MTNILLVNADNEFINDIKTNLNLYQRDWQISSVDSAKNCLGIVNSNDCLDIVIVGENLQDMPVLDLIKQIRDDSDVIVIFISQDNDISTLMKAYEVGASDCVAHPINMFLFVTRLKALIRRKNWDKQARKTKCFRKAYSE